MITPVQHPATTIVAGEVRHITGMTGDLLRMHDGAIYIHITPEVAKQWITVLAEIATKEETV